MNSLSNNPLNVNTKITSVGDTVHLPASFVTVPAPHKLTGRMTAERSNERPPGLVPARVEDPRGDNDIRTVPSIAENWGEFLGAYSWKWFTTLTFKDCTHPESAGKVFNNWIHRLNRDSYGQSYWKDKSKSVFWARGTEYQRRGVIHYHALVGGVPDFIRSSKYRDWWHEHVGLCKVEEYNPSLGGRYYMAKSAYTFKRGEIDVNEALVQEAQGSRTDAQALHLAFVRAYASPDRLHAGLGSYRW